MLGAFRAHNLTCNPMSEPDHTLPEAPPPKADPDTLEMRPSHATPALEAAIGREAATHARDRARDFFDMTFTVFSSKTDIEGHIRISAPVTIDFTKVKVEVVDAEFNDVGNREELLARVRSSEFTPDDSDDEEAADGGYFVLPAKRARTGDV